MVDSSNVTRGRGGDEEAAANCRVLTCTKASSAFATCKSAGAFVRGLPPAGRGEPADGPGILLGCNRGEACATSPLLLLFECSRRRRGERADEASTSLSAPLPSGTCVRGRGEGICEGKR